MAREVETGKQEWLLVSEHESWRQREEVMRSRSEERRERERRGEEGRGDKPRGSK